MKKIITIILLGLSVVGTLFCIFSAPGLFIQYEKESKDYPDSGRFYCEELDSHFIFSSEGIILEMVDGSQEDIYVHPAGRFCNADGRINVWYTWDNDAKLIEIEIISFPDAFKKGVFYFYE